MWGSAYSGFLAGLLAVTSTSVQTTGSTTSYQVLATLDTVAAATACPNATRTITSTSTAWVTKTASYDGSQQVTVTESDAETTTVTITT